MLTSKAIQVLSPICCSCVIARSRTRGAKCSSLKLAHAKPDPWPQLTNPIGQLVISPLSAHTAARPTLNHGRARGPEMDNLEPAQDQAALETDLVEVEEQFPALG
jgi:hypothetical protein